MSTAPSAEFYEERLARARAVPEAERSPDVRQWLQQHEELEAALAALPEVPASATPQHPLLEPLGGDTAVAAALRYLAAALSQSAPDPLHPKATLARLAPQLPPYFCVWRDPGNQAGAAAGRSLSDSSMVVIPLHSRIRSRGACWVRGLITPPLTGRCYNPAFLPTGHDSSPAGARGGAGAG